MKVCHVTPQHFGAGAYVGGGERYVYNLARGLAATADEHDSVEIVGPGDTFERVNDGPHLSIVKVGLSRRLSPLDWYSGDLYDVIRRSDVVHAHQMFTRTAYAAVLIAAYCKKPVFVSDQGGGGRAQVAPKPFVACLDEVVAYSRFGAEDLSARGFPVPLVIPGGVDSGYFTPAPVPMARTHILFVGRLLPHKNIELLIEAVASDQSLIVCGEPYDRRYFRYLKRLAGGKRVVFRSGATDSELRELYRSAIAVVLPSQHTDRYGNHYEVPELMGLVLLEAMSCGTPVICTRVGAMPEFVLDGNTGFVVDGLTDLRERLRQIATDGGLRDTMGRAARSLVDDQFSATRVARRLWDAYRSVSG